MTRPSLVAFLIAASFTGAMAAHADIIGARIDVSATVVPNCRLVVPPLSFGTYDPLDSNSAQPAHASTVISVSCTRSTGAALSFDFGLYSTATGERAMAGPGSEQLRYQIFRDAAHSLVWGAGTDGVRVISRGVSAPDQLSVFGRIPARQEVAPGAYFDLLTATVDF